MYYVKTKATRDMTRAAIGDRGRTGSRQQRVAFGVGSLATAQEMAKIFRANGLLR